mmetsp:Transcript_12638/g.18952  ORF Transcript_12638/g.18952 Transcript_12638/m.18952 type:complete len:231 (+) Transcript_12638:37-729(+)
MSSFSSIVQPWDEFVPKCWKDGTNFDREVLEKVFPGRMGDVGVKERSALWRALDNNGNKQVSLAEYDEFFKQRTGIYERKHGFKLENGKSRIYLYARPCLMRAFALANGIAPNDDDEYISRAEFRCLMVATQCALIIYRIFDIADSSNDRRVSRKEWHQQLDLINSELAHFGSNIKVSDSDFDQIDSDGGGMILLDEAVHFFLKALTNDPNLLRENEQEEEHQPPFSAPS